MKFLKNLKQKPRHGIAAPKPVGLVKIKRKRTQIFRRERAYKAPLKGKWSAWRLCEMKLKTLIGRRQGEERAKKKMRTKTTSHHCHPTESPLPSLLQQPPLSLLLFPQAATATVATTTETTIPLPRPSSIREIDHNDVVSVSIYINRESQIDNDNCGKITKD